EDAEEARVLPGGARGVDVGGDALELLLARLLLARALLQPVERLAQIGGRVFELGDQSAHRAGPARRELEARDALDALRPAPGRVLVVGPLAERLCVAEAALGEQPVDGLRPAGLGRCARVDERLQLALALAGGRRERDRSGVAQRLGERRAERQRAGVALRGIAARGARADLGQPR